MLVMPKGLREGEGLFRLNGGPDRGREGPFEVTGRIPVVREFGRDWGVATNCPARLSCHCGGDCGMQADALARQQPSDDDLS